MLGLISIGVKRGDVVRSLVRSVCYGNGGNRNNTYGPASGGPVSMAYTSFQSTRPEQANQLSPIIIMHGLMGSKINWKSMGKAINLKTGRQVYTVDARNHGDSPHTDHHSYPLLAEDLLFFLHEHNLPQAVLMGHSMGGRAVMAAALIEPSVVEKLVVLDISPVGTSTSISTLPRFLEIMRKVTLPPTVNIQEARTHIDNLLQPVIQDAGVRQFLISNLIFAENEYRWRLNLEGIARNFNPHISTFPAALTSKVFEGETAFIGGALSDYLRPEDEESIEAIFPQASFHYLEGAAHWLHADKPREFLELVTPLLNP
ncbi:hypothetical protein Pmani_014917 [Petrolisthes manimaculis]|uniref:sn-1-specific diacylglycerol lipase ABHD11 n=1 Tax=Petrolisthes manimaculis TaxID=1843537 RepID=A0AAE1UAH4_9EUCA|nr:hypothetical protein Pmani_014917 [Petrolisthes manimaculis]